MCTTAFLWFVCQWTSRLLPCPSYCKQCCDKYWGARVSFTSGFLGVYAQQWDYTAGPGGPAGFSLEGLMLKLKLQYFGHLMRKLTHWKRPWCWEGLGAGGEGDDRAKQRGIWSRIQEGSEHKLSFAYSVEPQTVVTPLNNHVSPTREENLSLDG